MVQAVEVDNTVVVPFKMCDDSIFLSNLCRPITSKCVILSIGMLAESKCFFMASYMVYAVPFSSCTSCRNASFDDPPSTYLQTKAKCFLALTSVYSLIINPYDPLLWISLFTFFSTTSAWHSRNSVAVAALLYVAFLVWEKHWRLVAPRSMQSFINGS